MTTYFMFGSYTPEGVKGISSTRTTNARAVIEKNGGEVKGMYALLGDRDICLIVDFPHLEAAVRTSLALHRLTGMSFSTSPAIPVETFDKLAKEAFFDA